jgi:hypothetical protein
VELLDPPTAFSVLSRYIGIQRAIVSQHETIAAELTPPTVLATEDRWNRYAEIIGREFRKDADELDAFIIPVSNAAHCLQQMLEKETETASIPFNPRPLTQDDLDLIRRLLEEFIGSCERCSAALSEKAKTYESADTLWNDAVSLLSQLLALIGQDSIGQFIVVDRQLRRTLDKASRFVESQKKPFSRDLEYHEGNAVLFLNLAANEARLDILNWLPKSLEPEITGDATLPHVAPAMPPAVTDAEPVSEVTGGSADGTGDTGNAADNSSTAQPKGAKPVKTKRKKHPTRNEPTEAELACIAELTIHHQYDGNSQSVGNTDPIGVRKLARRANVGLGTASKFFSDWFGDHKRYELMCADLAKLQAALSLLNQNTRPSVLNRPLKHDPSEDD